MIECSEADLIQRILLPRNKDEKINNNQKSYRPVSSSLMSLSSPGDLSSFSILLVKYKREVNKLAKRHHSVGNVTPDF